MVIHTYTLDMKMAEIKRHADTLAFMLATEKGYSSEVVKIKCGWRMVASDGKMVDFIKAKKG